MVLGESRPAPRLPLYQTDRSERGLRNSPGPGRLFLHRLQGRYGPEHVMARRAAGGPPEVAQAGSRQVRPARPDLVAGHPRPEQELLRDRWEWRDVLGESTLGPERGDRAISEARRRVEARVEAAERSAGARRRVRDDDGRRRGQLGSQGQISGAEQVSEGR